MFSSKMLCFVMKPDSFVLDIEVDAKAKGEECLRKVCEAEGIIETDYFGLQYAGSKEEQLWLNMRNPIGDQLSGQPPYHLRLRVKFFVQPHFLLQHSTRALFYQQMKQEFHDGKLKVLDKSLIVQLAAYIAYIDLAGGLNHTLFSDMALWQFFSDCLPCHLVANSELISQTAAQFHEYQTLQLSVESAQYRMLQLVSALEGYGVEYHSVKDLAGHLLHLGVGPEGLAIYDRQWNLVQSIAYPTIVVATHAQRSLCLQTLCDDGSCEKLVFKLVSQCAANALYRSVTEMHSFYRCDTVRNAVATQFSRDIKGTLASLFNENTTLGKKYVFDIERTCREAYDRARRVIYVQQQRHLAAFSTPELNRTDEPSMVVRDEDKDTCMDLEEDVGDLCPVCMDADSDTPLCSRCHCKCCTDCARQLTLCPLCRAQIQDGVHNPAQQSQLTRTNPGF